VILFRITESFTALFTREGDSFFALCPEIDVVSQGESVEEAKKNLAEAVQLFFECASESEVAERLSGETYVSSLEVQFV
jgi:predicted RNase H-like HicB family nuclease